MLAHTPTVVWQIDATGRFLFSSGNGLASLGLKPGEVVGQNVFDLYHDQPRVLASIQQALLGHEQQFLIEVRDVFFESWLSPCFNDQGEVVGAMGIAHDVTSRIRAQESERSSSERFLKAFHASPSGIMLTELSTGRILDVNIAFVQLYGLSRDELIGLTTQQIDFWPDEDTRAQILSTALATRKQARFTSRFRTKSGGVHSVQILMEVVELDNTPCALFIAHDAGKDQHVRRALKRSQKRYRELIRLAPVGIFRTNHQGHLVECNRHCLRLFQTDFESLQTSGWWPFIDASDRGSLQADWDRAIADHTSLTSEYPLNVQGERRWLQLQLEPGRSRREFIGSLTDITQQKLIALELQSVNARLEAIVRARTELLSRASITLEEQIYERRRTYFDLEKSEERWRSLVEHAPDVILLLNRQGEISYINHTAMRPSLTTADVEGRSVYEFAYPEYHGLMRAEIAKVVEQGLSTSHEVQGPGDSGNRHWYQSHLAPIHHGEQIIGATAIVRDVTESRLAAEQLRQTQDLLAHSGRVRMIGEMTAGFAHELGQPLSAISTYIEGCLIRLKREGETDGDVLDAMQEAVQEAQRAIEVVRRLRDFLQRNELQRQPEDLNQIVQDAVRLGEISLRDHGVRIQLDLAPELPKALLDGIQVMQVLLNLMLNAAEAMSEANSETREIQIVTRRTAGHAIECEVSDSGPGLPVSDANAIFEAFFTTKEAGLGLGLAITRRIVEAHQGQILAGNRTMTPGACFLVKFPLKS